MKINAQKHKNNYDKIWWFGAVFLIICALIVDIPQYHTLGLISGAIAFVICMANYLVWILYSQDKVEKENEQVQKRITSISE